MRFAAAISVVVLSCSHALAAPLPDDLLGTWAWQVEGQNLSILKLANLEGKPAGTIRRPTGLLLQPSAIGLGIARVVFPSFEAQITDTGTSQLGQTFRYQSPEGERTFAVRSEGTDRLRFSFSATQSGVPSVVLSRAHDNATVATNLPEGATFFVRSPPASMNGELAKLHDEDQADRRVDPRSIDWKSVALRDQARRKRVRGILDAGGLRSGSDFYHAALILQHGDSPNDYLVAHTMAITAVALGRVDATWIAAATLDRYLQNIGQPQIYGTQFSIGADGKPAVLSFDDQVIPDSVKQLLGVPTTRQQIEQFNRALKPSGHEPEGLR